MKKLSKRLLSVLLAALLVMTSIPMFALNAFAADTSAIDQAMAAYEQKMSGNFYTNMKAAYDAYMAAAEVKANASASASDIANAASALTAATENMGEFSGHVANGPVNYGTTDENPSPERYASVLWANGTESAYDQNQGGKSYSSTLGITYGGYYWFYYPTNTVLMYDGRNTPIMPIMMGAQDKDANYNIHPRYLYVESDDFRMTDDWVGYDDNFVWPATTSTRISYSKSNPQSSDDAFEMDNESPVRSFGNYITYRGTPTATLTTINGMTFHESHHMNVLSVGWLTSEDKDLEVTIPIRVINYKKLLDKLGEVGARYHSALDKVSDYKEDGGLSDLLEAIDYASTDPNSFFTTSNQYQACANWIDTAIANFNNITVTMDASAAASEEGARNALSAFEDKMTSGTYYKNILPVYDLYCKLHATVDAEKYGDGSVTKEDIRVATEALSNAMMNMETYSKYKATGKVTMAADSVAAGSYNQGIIQNVTTTAEQISTGDGENLLWMSVPRTVIALYDGETDIQIPVMADWHNSRGMFGRSIRIYDLYPTDNAASSVNDNKDYQFKNLWMCTNNNADNNAGTGAALGLLKWNVDRTPTNDTTKGDFGGYNKATSYVNGSGCEKSGKMDANNGGDIFVYENFLQYIPNGSSFTNGLKTSAMGFHWDMRRQDGSNNNRAINSNQNAITVYTIDYKTPWDAFSSAWGTIMGQLESGNYNEGGLATQIAKLDAFTAVNVADAVDGTTAASVASALATAGNNLTSGLEGTANSEYYQTLRNYINVKPEEGAASQYAGYAEFCEKFSMEQNPFAPTYWSEETWTPYMAAINAARAIMTNLPSNNAYYYLNPSAANTAATNLYNAWDALEVGGVPIKPVYDAYNELAPELIDSETGKLKDDVYTAESLATALTELQKVSSNFYQGPEDKRVDKDNQDTIDTEEAAFKAAKDALEEASFTKADEYAYYLEAAERGINDPDAYGSDTLMDDIDALKNAVYVTVDLPFFGEIRGIKENADQNVEDTWTAVQTDLNTKIQYTVTVVDADGNPITNVGEGTYAYGTSVTINAGEGDYKYDYVSITGNTDGTHKVKDIGTVDSFTFTVQGNTTITVGAPTDSKPIKVIYKAVLAGDHGSSFTIGTDYVASADDIDINAVKAPSYAFYKLDSKTKGEVKNNEVTVTLNYSLANGAQQFTIYNDLTEENETYYFNELVTIDMDDAPAVIIAKSQEDYDAWYEQCDAEEFTDRMVEIAAYGNIFTFRAREDLWTVYIDDIDTYKDSYKIQKDETNQDSMVYVRSQSNLSGTSVVTYNAIALPEDYEIVEAGLIAQYNKSGDDLLDTELNFNTVGKDQGNDKIRRLKATKVFAEEDNRYSITLNLASGAKVRYRAYVNYIDDQGNAHTVMSDVSDVITIG